MLSIQGGVAVTYFAPTARLPIQWEPFFRDSTYLFFKGSCGERYKLPENLLDLAVFCYIKFCLYGQRFLLPESRLTFTFESNAHIYFHIFLKGSCGKRHK